MNFGKNKINLFLRFTLEIAALVGYGYWGWAISAGWPRYFLMILFPIGAALIWGIFAVPDDPSRSGKAPEVVPGWLRLILEWTIFGLASLGWIKANNQRVGIVLAGLVVLHYLVSFDRIKWLLSESGNRKTSD